MKGKVMKRCETLPVSLGYKALRTVVENKVFFEYFPQSPLQQAAKELVRDSIKTMHSYSNIDTGPYRTARSQMYTYLYVYI